MIKVWTAFTEIRIYLTISAVMLGPVSSVYSRPETSTSKTSKMITPQELSAKESSKTGYQEPNPEERCTYRSYQWSTRLKKAVNRIKVNKKRSELTIEERDPDFPQCTVCQEDQEEIKLKGIPSVTVCKYFAPQVRDALSRLIKERRTDVHAFRINSLVGYRVGKTRGRLDKGLRMDFSNHSYGTAIDINSKNNGLYRPCSPNKTHSFKDVKRCKLRHGGHWMPQKRAALSISQESKVYQYFTQFWKWGGERKDRVRDFMHFSPTGL